MTLLDTLLIAIGILYGTAGGSMAGGYTCVKSGPRWKVMLKGILIAIFWPYYLWKS